MRCIKCGQEIGNTQKDYYFVNRDGYCLCEECGEEELLYSDDIGDYVPKEDYKDYYTDDEIGDLDIWDIKVNHFESVEEEPDWDAINDDIRMGLL